MTVLIAAAPIQCASFQAVVAPLSDGGLSISLSAPAANT
jgi:hypothetical protein